MHPDFEPDIDLFKTSQRIIAHLRVALRQPLPGLAGQQRMAPMPRAMVPAPGITPWLAAVLAPFYVGPDGLALLFTLRPQTLTQHAGQVSFPGGRREPGDADHAETALRETDEELGIPQASVEVLGHLTPLYISPSQTHVFPVVGWIARLPELHPNAREVAKVIEVPLFRLLMPETQDTCLWKYAGREHSAPCYRIHNLAIWGATAMIVSELLEILAPVVADFTPDAR